MDTRRTTNEIAFVAGNGARARARTYDNHSPVQRNSCGSPPGWRRWFDAMDASWLLHCTPYTPLIYTLADTSFNADTPISTREESALHGKLHRAYSLVPVPSMHGFSLLNGDCKMAAGGDGKQQAQPPSVPPNATILVPVGGYWRYCYYDRH